MDVEPITDAEAAARIQAVSTDTEAGHSNADDILCELLESLGYTKTVEAFKNLEKWYV